MPHAGQIELNRGLHVKVTVENVACRLLRQSTTVQPGKFKTDAVGR